jgi:FkbM family methyltransferase
MHKYFKKYSNKNKIALDIGANIGTHTIYLSDYFKEVYAFEPQKNVFELLESNVQINNCKNIITKNYGLGNSNKNEKMEIYDINSRINHGAIGIDKTGTSNGETINIKILDEMKLDNIGFIKIDVEGYEYSVLEGSKNTIEKSKPIIIIEINYKSIKDYTNIINFFNKLNYKLYRISSDDCLAIPM